MTLEELIKVAARAAEDDPKIVEMWPKLFELNPELRRRARARHRMRRLVRECRVFIHARRRKPKLHPVVEFAGCYRVPGSTDGQADDWDT